jgi:hypothetical protein
VALKPPRKAVWVIDPDRQITRRKWYHQAHDESREHLFNSRRFTEVLQYAWEQDPALIRLDLPDGSTWSIQRLSPPQKEPK